MIILILSKKDNKLIYEYSNLFENSESELDSFTNYIYNKHKFIENSLENDNYKWIKNVYWKLDIYSCIYVPRNKMWFNFSKEKLDNFWSNLEKERGEEESYKKYSPKKKIKKKNLEVINLNNNEC